MRNLKELFPQARAAVATAAVKADIVGFSTWIESVGWLDAIPRMKVKSEKNQDGFAYEVGLEVLAESTLLMPGGGTFQLKTDYAAIEAARVTTVLSPDLPFYCRPRLQRRSCVAGTGGNAREWVSLARGPRRDQGKLRTQRCHDPPWPWRRGRDRASSTAFASI